MNILSSWSGNQSRHISSLLKVWIPRIIQNVEIWHSEEDIPKGKLWFETLRKQLEQVDYGIICLTKENLDSKWIYFEAGALQKKLDESAIFTLLYDLKPTDIEYPLAGFQHTILNDKRDFRRLIDSINNIEEINIDTSTLDYTYNRVWDEFSKEFSSIPTIKKDESKTVKRNDRELLEELLNTVRNLDRSNSDKLSVSNILSTQDGLSKPSRRILRILDDAPKTTEEIRHEIKEKYNEDYPVVLLHTRLMSLLKRGFIKEIFQDGQKKYLSL
ncbi:MAG: toll/interleukin-1 receptor domain-containing protein [Actinobacteria bacterium]|nr:toll/interleukin-1 receptor domain-containing protein [Actinomycetota bacterium]MBE3122657.1 toll/interleukin-1 receptor domain-containing protein [Thermoplasmata archaeon]